MSEQQLRQGDTTVALFPLNLPGFMGLNKQAQNSVIGPEWATELTNTVLDDANRVSSRKGFSVVTGTALGAQIVSSGIFETAAGAEELIVLTATTAHKSDDSGATFSTITGTASFTDGNWQLAMFNGDMIGVQNGKDPIRYQGGAGTFAHISGASAPKGGAMLSAFGRLWVSDETEQVMHWCALLDPTDWTGTDTGSFDFNNVWKGTDTIVAIEEFNGALIVFGSKNIIVLRDTEGTALGINPLNLVVEDVIPGIGCIARDTVASVDGDLWFLSNSGLISLGRLIIQQSNPMDNLSANIQDHLRAKVDIATSTEMKGLYSPEEHLYILSLPRLSGAAEIGTSFAFDTRGSIENGAVRVVGEWGLVPTTMVREPSSGDILLSRRASLGEIGKYSGTDDDGSSFEFDYQSGWISLGSPMLKMVKRLAGLFFIDGAVTLTFKWAFDFEEVFKTETASVSSPGSFSEWGSGEWGLSEWSGGVEIADKAVGGRGKGEFIKVGINVAQNTGTVAIQQLKLFAKIGRLA